MIWENITLAASSLRANKTRALLTMLGIIIGIASVIAIVSIGSAIKASLNSSLTSFGAANITVGVQERGKKSIEEEDSIGEAAIVGKTPTSADLLTDKMITEFRTRFKDVIRGVSISYSGGNATAKDKDLYANVVITGQNEDYTKVNNLKLITGRAITQQDLNDIANVAVVSDKLVQNMFPAGTNVIGKTIKIYNPKSIDLYTIIGVYKFAQDGLFGGTASDKDMQTALYIPLSTAKKDVLEKNFQSFTVVAKADEDINALTKRFQQFFDGVYATNRDWKATAFNMTSMLDTMTSMLNKVTAAVAVIGAISLIVGGIGVMNIMLVSVTERTKEIGTRKALGAKTFHIQLQFLIEAVIVTVTGGVIGIILGLGLGALVSLIMGVGVTASLPMILLSFLFSMAIGLFFGLYPASKAAKLDPIDALRYE